MPLLKLIFPNKDGKKKYVKSKVKSKLKSDGRKKRSGGISQD